MPLLRSSYKALLLAIASAIGMACVHEVHTTSPTVQDLQPQSCASCRVQIYQIDGQEKLLILAGPADLPRVQDEVCAHAHRICSTQWTGSATILQRLPASSKAGKGVRSER